VCLLLWRTSGITEAAFENVVLIYNFNDELSGKVEATAVYYKVRGDFYSPPSTIKIFIWKSLQFNCYLDIMRKLMHLYRVLLEIFVKISKINAQEENYSFYWMEPG
jgi:hypothetical protein